MYFVYILLSLKEPHRFYIGITNDLKRRLLEHNNSLTGYSKRYAPWKVETFLGFHNKKLALDFEHYLKSGSGHAFLKKHLI